MLLANLAPGSTTSLGLGSAHGALSFTRSLAFFQNDTAVSHVNTTLLTWVLIVAAVALVLQMLILLGMALGGAKIAKELMKYVEEARAKAMPLISTTHDLVRDLTPQIKQITNKVEVIVGHVEGISAVAVDKVNEFAPTVSAARITVDEANQTVRDANRKTHEQVERVNLMVSGALDATARMGQAIQRGISLPGREVAGIVSSVKAGVNSLVNSITKPSQGSRSKSSTRRPGGSPYRSGSPYREAGSPYRQPHSPQSTSASRPDAGETTSFTDVSESPYRTPASMDPFAVAESVPGGLAGTAPDTGFGAVVDNPGQPRPAATGLLDR